MTPPPTEPTRLAPHVCDYVDPDGTTAGACHLTAPHGGRCPTCVVDVGGGRTVAATADDCDHQPGWETALLCPVRDCAVHG